MSIFSIITGGLGAISGIGNAIAGISSDIAKAKIAALEAGTDSEKIEAGRQIGVLETRRDVLVAEAQQGNRLSSVFRAALAFPWVVYFAKVLVWDKVLHELTLANTPPVDPTLWWVGTVIIGFYFLTERRN